MGASAREDKLEIMVSTPAFYQRTGIVCDYREIEWRNLPTQSTGLGSKKQRLQQI